MLQRSQDTSLQDKDQDRLALGSSSSSSTSYLMSPRPLRSKVSNEGCQSSTDSSRHGWLYTQKSFKFNNRCHKKCENATILKIYFYPPFTEPSSLQSFEILISFHSIHPHKLFRSLDSFDYKSKNIQKQIILGLPATAAANSSSASITLVPMGLSAFLYVICDSL